jgi:hypothetical protein
MHDLDIGGSGELETYEGQAELEEERYGQESLSEADETELAGELLSVGSEAELEQFLGDFVKSVGRAVGRVAKIPIPPALTNALKGVAKQALPQLGSAIGGMFGGATGSKVGGTLASQAGKMFGLELEGLSSEDREFEVARHFIRFATDATKRFLTKGASANPMSAARSALMTAAKRHAPGLISVLRQPSGHAQEAEAETGAHSGRWMRRGTKLILFGV